MLSAMAPHGREITRPEKENYFLHKKGEGYKKEDQQSFTYQSEYCSKSGTNILKKMELQPSHRDVQVVHGS